MWFPWKQLLNKHKKKEKMFSCAMFYLNISKNEKKYEKKRCVSFIPVYTIQIYCQSPNSYVLRIGHVLIIFLFIYFFFTSSMAIIQNYGGWSQIKKNRIHKVEMISHQYYIVLNGKRISYMVKCVRNSINLQNVNLMKWNNDQCELQ